MPLVRFRKVTAMRSLKGSWASFSWMSPKEGEESGGKGMQETVPAGGRFFFGVVGGVDLK